MGGDAGVRWRAIELADAGELAATSRAVDRADSGAEVFSEEDWRALLEDPLLDVPRGTLGVWAGGTLAGFGGLEARAQADPVHRMHWLAGVHPDYRGRGFGARLLDWAEGAAVPLHEERFPGRPLAVVSSCVTTNAGAVALHESRGYRATRWFHLMVRDLTAKLPEVPAPPGVEIAGFTPERSQDARLTRNDAFRDHWGSTESTPEMWEHSVTLPAFRPQFSFVAYGDGQALGLLLGQEYEVVYERPVRELYVALVGTRRAGRKRGIGSALLVAAMRAARDAGCTSASLSVDADSPTGALGLYERAGFTVDYTTVSYEKQVLAR